MNKKRILGFAVAFVIVVAGMVGLTSSSASAAPTCGADTGEGIGTMTWVNATVGNDEFHGTSTALFKRCTTESGAPFLLITGLQWIRAWWDFDATDCGTVTQITANPEDLGVNHWNPDPKTKPCVDDQVDVYEWTAPANTRMYTTSTLDERCIGGTYGFSAPSGYYTRVVTDQCP